MVTIDQKKINLSLRINTKVLLAYLFFLFFNIIYYLYFTTNWECYTNTEPPYCNEVFYHSLIGDSAKAYLPNLSMLIETGALNEWSVNNYSHYISYIYYFLWLIFRFKIENAFFVAFIVNNILVILSYVFFVRIGREIIGLQMRLRWLYFLNPLLIYTSQMISKESFLLALIMMIAYYLNNNFRTFRERIALFFTLVTTVFVRYPFILLGVSRYICKENHVIIKRLIFIVVTLLLLNGYRYSLINPENSQYLPNAGVALKAFEFNHFYLGSLLLAPVKIIANCYDLLTNLFSQFVTSKINFYQISSIPITIALLTKYKMVIFILMHPIAALRGPLGPLLAFVIIFLVIISANIYIHDRYLWPILPLLMLVLIGIKKKHLRYRR